MELINEREMKSARPVLAADGDAVQHDQLTDPQDAGEQSTEPDADPIIAEQVERDLGRLDLRIQATGTAPATVDIHTTDAPLPAHLWPCGCLPNGAAEHRPGCPEHSDRVRRSWPATVPRRVMPGELEEIEHRARRGQMIHPAEALALVRTIQSLVNRVIVRYDETAEALQRAADAEQVMTESTLLERAERAEQALELRGPMADLGHLASAVARAEQAERQLAARDETISRLQQRVDGIAADGTRYPDHLAEARVEIDDLRQTIELRNQTITELERTVDGYRRSHVCTDRCRPNAHIAFEGRQLVMALEERLKQCQQVVQERDAGITGLVDTVNRLHAQRDRDTQQLAEIRQRFSIDPGADLYQALSSRVGDLQTSEAELVSAPLQAQVRQLERQVTSLEAENADLLAQAGALAQEVGRVRGRQAAAEQRAARYARRQEEEENRAHAEQLRAEQLAAELKIAQDRAAEDKRTMDRLEAMNARQHTTIVRHQQQETVHRQQLRTGGQILDQVRQLVTAEGVDRAAEDLPEVDQDQASAEAAAGYYLARVIQQVRDAVGVHEPAQQPPSEPVEQMIHSLRQQLADYSWESDSARQERREE